MELTEGLGYRERSVEPAVSPVGLVGPVELAGTDEAVAELADVVAVAAAVTVENVSTRGPGEQFVPLELLVQQDLRAHCGQLGFPEAEGQLRTESQAEHWAAALASRWWMTGALSQSSSPTSR